jgi:hypothetical protein
LGIFKSKKIISNVMDLFFSCSSVKRVSLIVGFEAALAGVVGVASGSLVGQKLRKRFPTADAQVCAWSMVICAPLLYWGCYIATGPPVPLYIVLFFGQWFLNVSWFVFSFFGFPTK